MPENSVFALFDIRHGCCIDWEYDLESLHASEEGALKKARQMGYVWAIKDRRNFNGIEKSIRRRKNMRSNSEGNIYIGCVIEQFRLDPVYTGVMELCRTMPPLDPKIIDLTQD